MDFLKLAGERYSSREYKTTPVPVEKMEYILEAVRIAPTECNSQQIKVLAITSSEGLKRAAECSECTYGAPAVLIFCYDKNHPDSFLPGRNNVNVGLTDACIAATHAMLAAKEQGLDTCWVCWFYEDKTIESFELPEGIVPALYMPLGYAADVPSERHYIRKPIDEIVDFI